MLSDHSAEFTARRILPPLAAALIALAGGLRTPAQAQPRNYIIDGSDGYGVTECVASGVACGKMIADGWCEAHGGGQAAAFGLASDVTAAIPGGSTAGKLSDGAVIITCAE